MKKLEAYCLGSREAEAAFRIILTTEGFYEHHGNVGVEIKLIPIARIAHGGFNSVPYLVFTENKDLDKKAYRKLKEIIERFDRAYS